MCRHLFLNRVYCPHQGTKSSEENLTFCVVNDVYLYYHIPPDRGTVPRSVVAVCRNRATVVYIFIFHLTMTKLLCSAQVVKKKQKTTTLGYSSQYKFKQSSIHLSVVVLFPTNLLYLVHLFKSINIFVNNNNKTPPTTKMIRVLIF